MLTICGLVRPIITVYRVIQNDPPEVFTFFTELNVSFGARLMIFWDIIVGHFVIQAGFGDSLTFIELHGYRVCLFQIMSSPASHPYPGPASCLTCPAWTSVSGVLPWPRWGGASPPPSTSLRTSWRTLPRAWRRRRWPKLPEVARPCRAACRGPCFQVQVNHEVSGGNWGVIIKCPTMRYRKQSEIANIFVSDRQKMCFLWLDHSGSPCILYFTYT